MDVAETAGGDGDVLRRYLYVAMDLGALAEKAFFCPGVDVIGKIFPYVPGGDEAAGRSHTWVSRAVEVVEHLAAEFCGDQRAKRTCRGVAEERQIADFLGDNEQILAVAELLYLRAEDLAEGHVPEVEGGPVGDGCAGEHGGRGELGVRP
jgi:hypothetical protein